MTRATLWMNLENIAPSDHMLEDYTYMKGPEQVSPEREREGEWGVGWGDAMGLVQTGTGFLLEGTKMS